MKSLFLAFCAVLILAFSVAAAPTVRPFTQEDVLKLYSATARAVGNKPGSLYEDVNTTLHTEFIWTWEEHGIHIGYKASYISKSVCSESTSRGYSCVIYVFLDADFDGQVDICYRKLKIIGPDGSYVLWNPAEPELQEVLVKWMNEIPNAQELYEEELAYWYYRLIDPNEEMN